MEFNSVPGPSSAGQGQRATDVDGQHRGLLRQRDDRIVLVRMQVELLDRRRWKTRIELANVIFEYLGIWHNRQRRHGRLGWLAPVEFELQQTMTVA